MLKVKNEFLNIETLQKYGFKTGKQFAEEGERAFCGSGYTWKHKHFFKVPVDPDEPDKLLYADETGKYPPHVESILLIIIICLLLIFIYSGTKIFSVPKMNDLERLALKYEIQSEKDLVQVERDLLTIQEAVETGKIKFTVSKDFSDSIVHIKGGE